MNIAKTQQILLIYSFTLMLEKN